MECSAVQTETPGIHDNSVEMTLEESPVLISSFCTELQLYSVDGGGGYDIVNNQVIPTPGPPPNYSSHIASLQQSWEINYQEAAIYLQEGENNDKFFTHPRNPKALAAYLFAHNHLFYMMELLTGLLLMVLSLSEAPAVPSLRLDVYVHATLELLALVMVAFELCMKLRWLGFHTFIRHKRTMVKTCVLLLQFVEAIVVLIRQTSHLRVTRALRPIFLVDCRYCGAVRRNLRQIFQSLPPFIDILLLLLFFMVIFAILGFCLFSPNTSDPYFNTLENSIVSLFVLLTTANFPDVMMPAYSRNRWSCVFFIVYLSIELYFIMNLLLAVVFDTFNGVEKMKFKSLMLHKRSAIDHAFQLLVSRQRPMGLSLKQFDGLMRFYRPRMSARDRFLTYKALNTAGAPMLSLDDFYKFYEVIGLKWKARRSGEHWFDDLPHTTFLIFKGINLLVKSKAFQYTMYVVVAVNGVWILVETYMLNSGFSSSRIVPWSYIVFLTIYGVEVLLKVTGMGPLAYFSSGWNLFDFFVTVFAFLGLIALAFDMEPFYFIVVLRPLQLLRLFKIKQRYRNVLDTMFELFPRMASLGLTLIIFYYSFAIVGMEFFADVVYPNCCNTSTVADSYRQINVTIGNRTVLDEGYYYLNNFDNILSSFVTLFELTVVNNWYITMEGVTSMTTHWSRLYFMTFYIVTMVVMTIIVAFILDAFVFRMNYSRKNKEPLLDPEDENGIVFEAEVSRDEALATLELYKQTCPGLSSLNSLQGVLVAMDRSGSSFLVYLGRRSRTKSDLSMKMYEEEIQEWYAEYSRENLPQSDRSLVERELEIPPPCPDPEPQPNSQGPLSIN
ncbi:two pore calcium channel protein 1 isoform X1 [Oncorhynchus mykiss]|uniref:Voltage-dependent calcium channel protein TPC1 n=1 Tax=Oncorhynchus mykiss TaxID=8022 RepID=A0A8C7Q5V1_ONCMY|nr:two pore calcium channel protein 1 isoform X1 [Oncorhynchus mykiss]XP_036835784.1 two pore calcium channel protein 1 isoform X1 [Oncorhynchus mykiss]XP_036835785.1 two pore calcium channel protein 1 isoform X1 [Oncorhynchus mykiss]